MSPGVRAEDLSPVEDVVLRGSLSEGNRQRYMKEGLRLIAEVYLLEAALSNRPGALWLGHHFCGRSQGG
jgi:hypothetical protein